ncbi:MAG: HAMP domain-containing protein [Burkholderiales bacterium]|nr:HAMP domain-containing protein [Burkholderiales bacterium]
MRWPDTLFGRLLLIFLAGLVAAHALSFWLVFMERGMAARQMMGAYLAQDISSAVAILERVPPAERAGWLPRLERRNYSYRLGGPEPVEPSDTRLARQVTVAVNGALGPRYSAVVGAAGNDASRLRLQLRLADGTPLTVDLEPPRMEVSPWVVAVLAMQLLLLLALTWWAVRLATRPLQQLADAADALGPGAPAQPLSEEGPREVAKAARAFNAIQQRIGTYLAERMQILAAVSHDLQTPITRMRLRAELLDDTALRDKLQHDLDAMQELVKEGIAYARSAHSANEEPVRVDLRSLLDTLVCDCVDAGQKVTLEMEGDITLTTRPLALGRIVGNLVDNAVKFGGEAQVVVERENDAVVIAVRDRGPGIPEAELESVLKPFVRLENSRSRETGGSGLGLAIAQQLAAAAGGTLALVNRQGGGLEARLRVAVQASGRMQQPQEPGGGRA